MRDAPFQLGITIVTSGGIDGTGDGRAGESDDMEQATGPTATLPAGTASRRKLDDGKAPLPPG